MVPAIEILLLLITPLLIFLIGIFGNGLTIVSSVIARKRNKYGFRQTWNTSTLHVLNLSIIDFLYSMTCFVHIIYVVCHYARQGMITENGINEIQYRDEQYCTFLRQLQIFLSTGNKWSISLIAVTRTFAIINNKRWENFCDKKRNVVSIILIPWILSILLSSFGFQERYNRDKHLLVCVPEKHSSVIPFRFLLLFPIETSIIILSYLCMYFYVAKQSRAYQRKYLSFNEDTGRLIRARNIRLAKTMGIIGLSSVILCLPVVVVELLFEMEKLNDATYSHLCLLVYNVWILQHSINLFIYVWRKDENMCAIMDVILTIFPNLVSKSQKRKMDKRMRESIRIVANTKQELNRRVVKQ